MVVVVVVECYCFITNIIVGAVGARWVVISYVLHHVLACHLVYPPFYTIKALPAQTAPFVVVAFLMTVL